MRTYIRHEDGGYVDAATVTEITASGEDGGLVGIKSAATLDAVTGHIVARLMTEDAYRDLTGETQADREAWERQAAVLAESLLHAICRADAIARRDSNGATIRFDAQTSRWTVTDLGKTAADPIYA